MEAYIYTDSNDEDHSVISVSLPIDSEDGEKIKVRFEDGHTAWIPVNELMPA